MQYLALENFVRHSLTNSLYKKLHLMENPKKFNYLFVLLMCLFSFASIGQQTTIDYNSDSDPTGIGPQLLLLESGDSGSAGADGWSRLWFRNATDATNRWGFLARPHAGAQDNDGILTSPLVMAYTGTQRFGFGSDGTLRINKQYTLPNMDGNPGDVLTTDGAGNVSWASSSSASTVKIAFDANGINAGKFAEDLVAIDSFIYLDNAINAYMYYALPVPEGATLKKVSMVAADIGPPASTTSAWKIRMVLLKNTTSNSGTGQSSVLGSVNTTDTSTSVPSIFQTFDINTNGVIGPGEGILVKIYSSNSAGNPTVWPGDVLKMSKILLEYDMP